MIKGLIEVIIYVENMDAQVSFYRDILDLELSYPKDLPDYSDEMWVTFNTGACVLALHGGGKKRIGQDAPRIVFEVDDINAVRSILLEKKVGLGDVRPAAPGVYVCDGMDPEGNSFSIESHE